MQWIAHWFWFVTQLFITIKKNLRQLECEPTFYWYFIFLKTSYYTNQDFTLSIEAHLHDHIQADLPR